MKIVLCFALLVAVAAAASPPRPNFPTMYEAQTVNEFRNGTHRFVGDGWQAVDIPANKAVEGYNFDVAFSHFALQRGDLHRAYDIDTRLTHLGQCHERNITARCPTLGPGWPTPSSPARCTLVRTARSTSGTRRSPLAATSSTWPSACPTRARRRRTGPLCSPPTGPTLRATLSATRPSTSRSCRTSPRTAGSPCRTSAPTTEPDPAARLAGGCCDGGRSCACLFPASRPPIPLYRAMFACVEALRGGVDAASEHSLVRACVSSPLTSIETL